MKRSFALLAASIAAVTALGQTVPRAGPPQHPQITLSEMLCGNQGMPPTSTEIRTAPTEDSLVGVVMDCVSLRSAWSEDASCGARPRTVWSRSRRRSCRCCSRGLIGGIRYVAQIHRRSRCKNPLFVGFSCAWRFASIAPWRWVEAPRKEFGQSSYSASQGVLSGGGLAVTRPRLRAALE
jgi:hypothetical protein